jgi:aspartyl-tRNA(Asn)/glutamyl-tRNA(Gln) amidotransferase subunit A
MRTIIRAGAAGLAELYRNGTLTPRQVVECYYSRISAYDASLGAYVWLLEADATREAEESTLRWAADRPLSALDGVPIAVKANIAVKGAPWHAGILAYADRIAAEDAACVAALRRRGAIVIGLLAMDEGAMGATGDNPWLGRTRNPYDLGFSPGGSSSGAGVAVAAGLCAAALGTDTMGSVRLPAAFCGCVGYKPSRDLISRDGVVALANSLDHVGVLARSVEDCALVAAAASGRIDSEPSALSPPPNPPPSRGRASDRIPPPRWGRLGGGDLGMLAAFDEQALASESKSAIVALIDRAAVAGANIVPLDFSGYDFSRVRRHCLLAIEVEAMREYPWLATETAGFSEGFVKMLRYGAAQPETKIAQAYEAIRQGAGFIREQLSNVSAMILPMTPGPAHSFGDTPPVSLGDFAAPANIVGGASVAVPIGLSAGGFPLSVQCLGLDDAATLTAARRLAALVAPIPPAPGLGLE